MSDKAGRVTLASSVVNRKFTFAFLLARFVRKSMNCSKILGRHTHALDFFQAWYNFVKPHSHLGKELIWAEKKWMQRSPAMAEGLTDHIWTIKELMAFRIPIQ